MHRIRLDAAAMSLATPLMVLVACGPAKPPAVEVSARIGERNAFEAPSDALGDVEKVFEAVTASRTVDARDEPDAGPSPAARPLVLKPPRDAAQFERALSATRKGDIDDLASVVRNLAECPPAIWPEVAATIAGDSDASKTQYKRILDLIGGDVPNRYGHFDRHWKRDHGYQVKLSENWFEDLLSVPLPKIARSMHPVYRELLLRVALMRAAAKIGREDPTLADEAVDALLDLAYADDGALRDEVGRAIVAMGENAVPQLVRRMPLPTHNPRLADSVPVRQAKYAAFNLDRMDRMQPGRTLDAVRHRPDLLRDVLEAYGEAKFGDAASYLLEFFDAPSPEVRDTARASFLALVTGPPPKVRATTVRTLGGGTTKRLGHLSYRGLATLAIRDALEQRVPNLLEPEPPCDVRREDGTYDQRCIEQPLRLTRAYIEHLDGARRGREVNAIAAAMALEAKDPVGAMEAIDTLMATGVGPRYATELVPFMERAISRAQREGDPRRTGQLLRKLAQLVAPGDPKRAQRLRARAFLAEAQAPGLSAQGRHMLRASAVALAPADPKVAAAAVGDQADLLSARVDPKDLERRAAARTELARRIPLLLLALGGLAFLAGSLRDWLARRSPAAS